MIVYTAIIGVRELLKPRALIEGVRCVCFTDQKNLLDKPPGGWEVIEPELRGENSRRTARKHKLLPHELFDDPITLWIDGFVTIGVYPLSLSIDDLSVFTHPQRKCVYAEAKACVSRGKDSIEKVNKQVTRYRSEGYPANNGLAATGALLRRNGKDVIRFNELWWSELSGGSVRDQISFDYCAWKLGMRYDHLPRKAFKFGRRR